MSVIESFLTVPHQTLSEVAGACGLESPTAIRYLRQLVERGWLERDETTKRYSLGVALVTIGAAAQSTRPIRIRALPYLRDLLLAFDETVNIAIHHNNKVVVIEALESGRSVRRGAAVGERDEWFVSGLGKSILAHLPESDVLDLLRLYPPAQRTSKTLMERGAILSDLAEIRQRGYAIDNEESEIGLKCIAVPVWNGINGVSCALSVSGPPQRIDERMDEIVTALKAASAAISLASKGSLR